jgi:hypothetical protein
MSETIYTWVWLYIAFCNEYPIFIWLMVFFGGFVALKSVKRKAQEK